MLNLVVPTIYFSKLGSELLCCLVAERLVFVLTTQIALRAWELGVRAGRRQLPTLSIPEVKQTPPKVEQTAVIDGHQLASWACVASKSSVMAL